MPTQQLSAPPSLASASVQDRRIRKTWAEPYELFLQNCICALNTPGSELLPVSDVSYAELAPRRYLATPGRNLF
jgi:hypothetical protein